MADIFQRHFFLNEKLCLLIQISLKSVCEGPIDDEPALVEAVFAKLHRHITFCRSLLLNGWCWRNFCCIKMYWTPAKLLLLAIVDEYSFANAVEVMTWHWTGDKPLHEPMMTYFYDGICHHYAEDAWYKSSVYPKDASWTLTHCSPVMPNGNIDLGQHWLR